MDTPSYLEPLLDAKEVARILRLHPRTVLRLARAGTLPSMRYARHWRFRGSDVANWLDQATFLSQKSAESS
jgi:excisionase family DNA binding protein